MSIFSNPGFTWSVYTYVGAAGFISCYVQVLTQLGMMAVGEVSSARLPPTLCVRTKTGGKTGQREGKATMN